MSALEKRGLPSEFADHGTGQAIYKLTKHLADNGSFNSADTAFLQRWLYKVGREAAIDEMRKMWRLRSGVDTFNLSELESDEESTSDRQAVSGANSLQVAEARELCQKLWECIKELKPKEKFILLSDMQILAVLREYGGLESDLYDEDLSANAGSGVVLPGSLEDKRSRILKKLLAKLGRSTNG
jgi:hypothetical protein